MEFALYCIDKANHDATRTRLRAAHLNYTSRRQEVFRFGGPLMDDAGQARGSLMILELPDRAALQRHMAGDPFFSEGLFESVTIWQTRQVMPARDAGALLREFEQQRTAERALAASSADPSIEPQLI